MLPTEETEADRAGDLRELVSHVISANDRLSFKNQNVNILATEIRENVKGE